MASWRNDKRKTAERGYGARWQASRALYLQQNPLCVYCEREGRTAAATVVDHKVPHRGDMALFWDVENWAALCSSCHNSTKQRLEKSGRLLGSGVDGMPLDPNHRWNRK